MSYGVSSGVGMMGSADLLQRDSLQRLGQQDPQSKRSPMIPEQIDGMLRRTEALNNAIGALEDKLSAVAMPQPPQAANTAENRPTPGVPMAVALSEVNARLDFALARLQSLLSRIEL